MKKLLALFVGLIMLACATAGINQATAKARPTPEVEIYVDISNQTMTVDVDGWTYGRWKVSTARDGYHTPRGSWRPFLLKKMHYSRKYDNSPMPNSIFFLGGYAIHATYYINQLGRPASHGCIRLHPQNAAKLYSLVQKHGLSATRITISN
ncbi:MAG: L,D-transpeptidase [Hyphomicrobiales bacterium]